MINEEKSSDLAINKMGSFLRKAYAEWMGKQISMGQAIPSQNAFAQWIGITPTALSLYMNGNRQPSGDAVHKLATKLGPDVYNVLGLPLYMPNDKRLLFIATKWHLLNEEQMNAITEQVKNLVDEKSI